MSISHAIEVIYSYKFLYSSVATLFCSGASQNSFLKLFSNLKTVFFFARKDSEFLQINKVNKIKIKIK